MSVSAGVIALGSLYGQGVIGEHLAQDQPLDLLGANGPSSLGLDDDDVGVLVCDGEVPRPLVARKPVIARRVGAEENEGGVVSIRADNCITTGWGEEEVICCALGGHRLVSADAGNPGSDFPGPDDIVLGVMFHQC